MKPCVDVVGVGLITVDHTFRLPCLPAFGDSGRAGGRARGCGGPAATAMACLARLGATVRFVGKVGDDPEGEFLRAELTRQGVDASRVRVASGCTRVTLVLVEEATGERAFVTQAESFPPLSAADLEPVDVAGARIVHLDDADDTSLRAARLARQAGATVVFDGTWQSDRLSEFLPLVDHAVVSEFFARRWLPDTAAEEVLRRLVDLGAGAAVLTLGARGCLAWIGGDLTACAAVPVDVVDTTGAGDAFHGGYLFGLLQGWDTVGTLRFAAATAALNCRALGGQAGLPTRDEVYELLARTDPSWSTGGRGSPGLQGPRQGGDPGLSGRVAQHPTAGG